ncbi:hypothetical protein [Sinomicrobium soli]|uniref:hypothetical protein n=1 Tax=Sinomicrobium sp. N-1-3-6 TaxID=2219864 RepID=UPI000DCCE88E|nr:hypothetical protein [Sinomicrobium sp. N-1-3-6]RAV27468.1 hypothetical protein DN748_18525 [Sinomicrobium sp. N-1-3-6]
MKTKILILCLFALFQFSCSNDDDNPGTQITAENQFLGKITKPDGSDYVLINYNPDGTIHEIRQEFEEAYFLGVQYEYNNDGQIHAIYLIGGGVNTFFFHYDIDGTLTSYVYDDIEFPVRYHPAENLYEFDEGDDHCKVYLNEHGDVIKFSVLYFAHEEEEIYNFTYDPDKRGSLSNANPVALHTLITGWRLYLKTFISNNLTSRPFIECQADDLEINSVNRYDPNGFLKTANITNTQMETPGALSYEYIQP